MTEPLRCVRCGMTQDYAGANIEDIKKTCEEEREVVTPEGLRTVTAASEHYWKEIPTHGGA